MPVRDHGLGQPHAGRDLGHQSPLLIGALVGPLVAVALYQRSVHRAMRAMRLALTDPQTGLGNKRHFEELLQRYLDRADSDGTPVTLCLIDLDDFKTINDTYGHVAGDRALAQVAARLRRGGESFRVGGDEFALLLPGRTTEEGRTAAEALCQRVADARYDHGGAVSISIGVATYPSEGVERTDLVRVADKALYSAKGHGKARVHVYSPGRAHALDPDGAHARRPRGRNSPGSERRTRGRRARRLHRQPFAQRRRARGSPRGARSGSTARRRS